MDKAEFNENPQNNEMSEEDLEDVSGGGEVGKRRWWTCKRCGTRFRAVSYEFSQGYCGKCYDPDLDTYHFDTGSMFIN